MASLILGGVIGWTTLGRTPTVDTIVMSDEEATDETADSQQQPSTREMASHRVGEPGVKVANSSTDYADHESRERLRDQQQLPGQVLATMDLKPGQKIADVGAGSGYFSYFFSDAVGAQGRVWAVEISQKAVVFLNQRIEALPPPHPNIRVVHSREDDVGLEPGSLDWAFLCNVHLVVSEALETDRGLGEHRQGLECLKSIYRALKPGGRLAVIEPVWLAQSSSPSLHWSRNPSGSLDEVTIRPHSKSDGRPVGVEPGESRPSALTVEQMVSLYGQAGFQFVESYDFLVHKPNATPAVVPSAMIPVVEGGQLFFILEKPGGAE